MPTAEINGLSVVLGRLKRIPTRGGKLDSVDEQHSSFPAVKNKERSKPMPFSSTCWFLI